MSTLAVFVVLLVCIPSVYVVKPLGAVGTPAAIIGVIALGLWVLHRLVGMPTARPTPVHWLLLAFVAAMVASFTAGALRPTTGAEFTALWRGVLAMASWVGIALTVMDGLRSRARLEAFLRIVVGAGVALALLGVLQFLTGVDAVPLLHVPGLTQNTDTGGIYVRSGFSRVNGTALHAIEYGAVLSMILPIAFGQALQRQTHRVRDWLPVLLIGGALPLTVARSGMLGLAVGLSFAFLMMRSRQRLWFLAILPVLAVVFRVLVPGLLGTILSLFTSAGEDISIAGRTSDYGVVADFVAQSPAFGRGLFTFLPAIYRILDNQYLGTLVEAGIVGLLGLVVLMAGSSASALLLARATRRRAAAETPVPGTAADTDHLLPLSIGASLACALLLFATFDAFSFPMCMGTFSMILGASGAAWRLCRPAGAEPARPRAARGLTVIISAVVAVLAFGGLIVQMAEPSYDAEVTFAVAVLPQPGENIYDDKPGTSGLSDLVREHIESPPVRARLTAAGATDYTIAIGDGSLGKGTDVLGYGDVLRVRGTAADPDTARNTVDLVVGEIRAQLHGWQSEPGIDPTTRVAVLDTNQPQVFLVPVHRTVGGLGVVALAALTGLALSTGARRRAAAPAGPVPGLR
jgi:hypothetical protein